MYRTIDLCAGIGGIRKGFERTGHFFNVLSAEIDEYAALIGMDIITETDFVLTNADNKTTFQFRTPSTGGIELQ